MKIKVYEAFFVQAVVFLVRRRGLTGGQLHLRPLKSQCAAHEGHSHQFYKAQTRATTSTPVVMKLNGNWNWSLY